MMKVLHILFATTILLALFGCSNKFSEYPSGSLTLRIVVDGVTGTDVQYMGDMPIDNKNLSASISRNATLPSKKTGGLRADFVTRQDPMEIPLTDSQITSDADGNYARNATIPRATTQPMQIGYTYRLLIYNKTTGQLWRTVFGTAGTPLSLDIERGYTYEWYAYSYNSAEEIPVPTDTRNPVVETSVDKQLLYASGEISIPQASQTTQTDYAIGIVFQHKLTQVYVKIDATALARYGSILNLNASFDQNNYIKKGLLNIRTDQMSNIEVVPTDIIFNEPSASNIWEKVYYTVDPEVLTSYKITINDLPVRFEGVNASIAERNLATYFGVANKPTYTAVFPSPEIGQRLSNLFNLSYTADPLRILHISSTASRGYALEQGASWNFLNARQNFGDLPESIVKMGSWAAGQGGWIGGNQTDNKAENWIHFLALSSADNLIASRLDRSNTTNRPDIVILGYNVTTIRPTVATALNNYLNDNGVVILMLQNANNSNTMTFFNNLFNVSNIGSNSSGSGGSMFPIEGTNPNDEILNGPFGDIRGRHWGEDRGTTMGLINVPSSQITLYSYGNPINRSATAQRVTIFKHNTKSFFYIGDGGFVADNNNSSSFTGFPFRYDPVARLPLPKPYGNAGNGYTAGSRNAYNGIFMANIMAWAVKKAELNGIKQWKYAGPPVQ